MISFSVFFFGLLLVLAQSFFLRRIFFDVRQFQYRLLFSLVGLHLLLALVTQFFGVFRYNVLLGVHVVTTVVLWLISVRFYQKETSKPLNMKLLREWGLLTILVAAPVALSMVYFNYSGEYNITTNSKYYEAQHLSYPYPSVSDEWYAIGWIEEAIETQSLPMGNPYDETDETYTNYQFPFHSFFAATFLLFGVDPLEGYVVMSIFFNSILMLFLYSTMRSFGAAQGSAVLATTVALSIPWGATLLGLWCLIPATFGLITLVALMGESTLSDKKRALTIPLGVLIGLLLYPPFIVFLVPFALTILYILPNTMRLRYVLGMGVIVTLLCFVVLIQPELLSRLWYTSLLGEAKPLFVPHQLLPFLYIALAYVMVIPFKKQFVPIIAPWAVGLLLWALYAVTHSRFVVGYERTVVVVLFLTLLLSALGLTRLIDRFSQPIRRFVYLGVNVIAVLSVALTVYGYTGHDNWKNIVAMDPGSNRMFLPGAPVVIAFSPEDERVFAPLNGERFLSTPWKGTVVGTVTDNTPVVTQPGTVTMHPQLYERFVSADCEEKKTIVDEYQISYTYTTSFICSHFANITETEEGYVLKKVIRR